LTRAVFVVRLVSSSVNIYRFETRPFGPSILILPLVRSG